MNIDKIIFLFFFSPFVTKDVIIPLKKAKIELIISKKIKCIKITNPIPICCYYSVF